jgi:hypothetical protein
MELLRHPLRPFHHRSQVRRLEIPVDVELDITSYSCHLTTHDQGSPLEVPTGMSGRSGFSAGHLVHGVARLIDQSGDGAQRLVAGWYAGSVRVRVAGCRRLGLIVPIPKLL